MSEERNGGSRTSVGGVRRREIIRLAEDLAEDFTGEALKTDPLLISDELGLTSSFDDYGDYFDGLLHYEAGRFHIFCNTKRCGLSHSPRSRFTLSHELGHFFIPEHHRALRSGVAPSHPSFCSNPDATNFVEREADLFASRLLMPDARFIDVTAKFGFSLSGVRSVADELGTSLQATLVRFQASEAHPCAMIWWRPGKKPWSGVSRALRLRGLALKSPTIEGIPIGAATSQAHQRKPGASPDSFAAVSLANQWFRDVAAGSANDLIIHIMSVSAG